MLYRPLEEFYDLSDDPDQLNNRMDDPECRAEIERLRAMCIQTLEICQPPMADALKNVDQPDAQKAYMEWYGNERKRYTAETKKWLDGYREKGGLGTQPIQ